MSIAPKASTPVTLAPLNPASPNPLLEGKFTIKETRDLNESHRAEVLDIISTQEKIRAVAEWIIVNVSGRYSRCQTHALLGTIQKLLPLPGKDNEICQLLIHDQNFTNYHTAFPRLIEGLDTQILQAFNDSFESNLPFRPLMKELNELEGIPEELRIIGFSSDVSYQNSVQHGHFCKDFLYPHQVFSRKKDGSYEFEPLNALGLESCPSIVDCYNEIIHSHGHVTAEDLYNRIFLNNPDLPLQLMDDMGIRESYERNRAKMMEFVGEIYHSQKDFLTGRLNDVLKGQQSGNLILGTCADYLKSAYKIAKFSIVTDAGARTIPKLQYTTTIERENTTIEKKTVPCFVAHDQSRDRQGQLRNCGHWEVAIPVTQAVRAVLDKGFSFKGDHYAKAEDGSLVCKSRYAPIPSSPTSEVEQNRQLRSAAIQLLQKQNSEIKEQHYQQPILTNPTAGGFEVTLFNLRGEETLVFVPQQKPSQISPDSKPQNGSCNLM